jgi:hypothetical protein
MKVPPQLLERTVTLDVREMPLLEILNTVCGMAGMEMQFERYTVMFVAQERAGEAGR